MLGNPQRIERRARPLLPQALAEFSAAEKLTPLFQISRKIVYRGVN